MLRRTSLKPILEKKVIAFCKSDFKRTPSLATPENDLSPVSRVDSTNVESARTKQSYKSVEQDMSVYERSDEGYVFETDERGKRTITDVVNRNG